LIQRNKIFIDSQTKSYHPNYDECYFLLNFALQKIQNKKTSLSLLFVTQKKMIEYNLKYRNISEPTNVLSFSTAIPEKITNELGYRPIGDIIVCAQYTNKEAKLQRKNKNDHYKHIIIHGLLHLLGFDHKKIAEAKIMEQKEIELLSQLHIKNPYEKN
jgi:probable rRNA maturation factor